MYVKFMVNVGNLNVPYMEYIGKIYPWYFPAFPVIRCVLRVESCDNWGYEDWEDGGSPQETNALKQKNAHVLEALYPPGNKHIPPLEKEHDMIFNIAIPRKRVLVPRRLNSMFILLNMIVVTNL